MIIKVIRYEKIEVKAPPTSGPSKVPAVVAEAIVPKAWPEFILGVSVATNALELEIKPANTPCNILSKSSCQTFCTSPILAITSDIPIPARKIIGLRPFLSANLPHQGETIAETMNVPE